MSMFLISRWMLLTLTSSARPSRPLLLLLEVSIWRISRPLSVLPLRERLKKELDIPLMHDDQHGTAIISAAGLINALEVVGKKISDVKIVVNGAGAAAISCTKLYVALGARMENIVMLDSKGVISTSRTDLNAQKKLFATKRTDVHTLAEAVNGADVFLGLSKGRCPFKGYGQDNG
jgi:malic enzyme